MEQLKKIVIKQVSNLSINKQLSNHIQYICMYMGLQPMLSKI